MLARNSSTTLNLNDKSRHPCLILGLEENFTVFFTTEYNINCGFVIYGPYFVEAFSFYAQLL